MTATPNTTARSTSQIRPGQTLGGRYTLLSRIATGGMGEVWRARDTMTGMLVAAKVLRPELTGEEISLSRLRLEAQNAMKARHPNIAAVLDSGEGDGRGWIVMELVSGRPLVDFVGEGKTLPAELLIPILIQAGYALDGSAQRGVVHRDIKPANIMVRDDGLVKLTDFGISHSQGQATLTAVGMVMGTAQYLAPEQAMGSEATPLGDLYSLGIIAYEALAGNRPFTGKTIVDIAMAHVHQPVPDLPENVPTEMADVVYSLLEKDPQDRPESGIALVRLLTAAADAMGSSTEPTPLEQLSRKPVITKPTAAKKPVASGEPTGTEKPDVEVRRSEKSKHKLTARPSTRSHANAPTPAVTGTRTVRGTASSGALWHPLPARKVAAPTEPPQKTWENQAQFWRKPGFWVLVAVGVLLVVFVVVSYFGAKSSVSAYHQDCLALPSGSALTRYSQEVVSWLTPVLTF